MPRRAAVSTESRTASMPGAVPFDARQVALRGPAAVAVHDDGDVCRQTVELDLAGERLVGVSRPESTPGARQATRLNPSFDKHLMIVHTDQEQALRRRRRPRRRHAWRPATAANMVSASREIRARPRPASPRSPAPCAAEIRLRRSRYVEPAGGITAISDRVTVRTLSATSRCRHSETRRSHASPRKRPPLDASRSTSSRSGTCHTNARSNGSAMCRAGSDTDRSSNAR